MGFALFYLMNDSSATPEMFSLKEHKALLKDRVLQGPPEAHTRYLHVQLLLLALQSLKLLPETQPLQPSDTFPYEQPSTLTDMSLVCRAWSFLSVLFFFLMTISNADTCLAWNMTDTGSQEPLKTSEEVTEVRFGGRHHSFISPSKSK